MSMRHARLILVSLFALALSTAAAQGASTPQSAGESKAVKPAVRVPTVKPRTEPALPSGRPGLPAAPAGTLPSGGDTPVSGQMGSLQLAPPKLEVKELGGDFQKWTQQMATYDKGARSFRWLSTHGIGSFAEYEVRVGPAGSSFAGAALRHRARIHSLPQAGQYGSFNFDTTPYLSTPPQRLFVRIGIFNQQNQMLGPFSSPVVIDYKKQSLVTQKFQLDSIGFLSIQPASGKITGPAPSYKGFTDTNSVKILYHYDLVTENEALIHHWLLDDKGQVAANNYWLMVPIDKGKGQKSNVATIQCQTPTQPEIKIKGVKYKLMKDGNTLAEGTKMFSSAITFRCPKSQVPPPPESVAISSLAPAAGASILRAVNDKSLTDANSLKVNYSYYLASTDKAEIRQWALLGNGQVAPNNYWTLHHIHKKGAGSGTTRVAVLCESTGQSPTEIKGLRVLLRDAISKNRIIEKVFEFPVTYTFRCPGVIKPEIMKKRGIEHEDIGVRQR